jgi:hypothetical protein
MQRAQELLELDNEFRKFAEQRGGFYFERVEAAAKLRAKTASVVAARLLAQQPGRWSLVPYTGLDGAVAVLESNPRLIALFCRMVVDDAGRNSASTEDQAEVLRAISRRYLSLLETTSLEIGGDHAMWSKLQGLVTRLGDFLSAAVLRGPFGADFYGHFKIDSMLLDHGLLVHGVNVGALSYIPPAGERQNVVADLRPRDGVQKAIRLSFVFYPDLRLPTKVGREVSLERVLGGGDPRLPLEA